MEVKKGCSKQSKMCEFSRKGQGDHFRRCAVPVGYSVRYLKREEEGREAGNDHSDHMGKLLDSEPGVEEMRQVSSTSWCSKLKVTEINSTNFSKARIC